MAGQKMYLIAYVEFDGLMKAIEDMHPGRTHVCFGTIFIGCVGVKCEP
jgi:hypothetical protein